MYYFHLHDKMLVYHLWWQLLFLLHSNFLKAFSIEVCTNYLLKSTEDVLTSFLLYFCIMKSKIEKNSHTSSFFV